MDIFVWISGASSNDGTYMMMMIYNTPTRLLLSFSDIELIIIMAGITIIRNQSSIVNTLLENTCLIFSKVHTGGICSGSTGVNCVSRPSVMYFHSFLVGASYMILYQFLCSSSRLQATKNYFDSYLAMPGRRPEGTEQQRITMMPASSNLVTRITLPCDAGRRLLFRDHI